MTPTELRDAYKICFSTPDGKSVLDDMEKRFSIHASTFSSEATETAYREGQRTVVLFIKQMLQDRKDVSEYE